MNFIDEILEMRHLLVIMKKKIETMTSCVLFRENRVSLRIYVT